MRYTFDNFAFDSERYELTDADGNPVDLQPRSLDLLALLLRNAGALVDKETITQEIWGGLRTSPGAMRLQVRKLRAALSDNDEPHRLIETVHSKGLRFVGELTLEGDPQTASEAASEEVHSAPVAAAIASAAEPQRTGLSSRIGTIAAIVAVLAAAVTITFWFGLSTRETVAQSSQTPSNQVAVAVLPFREVGGRLDQAYLGAGLADELSNVLAQVDGFKVSSSSSAFRFSGDADETNAQAAEALGVTHLIEGSFAQVGPSLKVTVNLVDAAADDRVWTATYARPYSADSVVRVQEQIVSALVTELLGELLTSSDLPKRKTNSLEALDLYYRAKASQREQTPSAVRQAIAYLNQATEIDPQFGQAYSQLVIAYDDGYAIAGLSWDEVVEGRRKALAKALEFDPYDPQTLIAHGIVKSDDGDNREAISLYQKALATDPNNSFALGALAVSYSQIGRAEEERDFFRQALAVDPLSPAILQGLTFAEYSLGNAQTALEVAKTNMRWNGDNPAVQDAMAWLLIRLGDYAGAVPLYVSILEENARNDTYAYNAADLYVRIGWDEQALRAVSADPISSAEVNAMLSNRAEVEQFLARNSDRDLLGNTTGIIHFYLRDYETALPYVRRALEELEVTGPAGVTLNSAVWFLGHAHVLCELGDPECEVLLEKIEEPVAGLTPQTAETSDAFFAAAGVQMLRGNQEKALDWLEAAFEAGHTFVHLKRHPTFEPLVQTARYQALETRMEIRAKGYRDQFRPIVAQGSGIERSAGI